MRDLSEKRTYLKIKISRDRIQQSLIIRQKCYAHKLFERFGTHDAKPFCTSIDRVPSQADNEAKPFESTIKKQAIGSLMYLTTRSRQDIAYDLGNLPRFMESSANEL